MKPRISSNPEFPLTPILPSFLAPRRSLLHTSFRQNSPMVITRKIMARLSAGEILDELLTYEAMRDIPDESHGPYTVRVLLEDGWTWSPDTVFDQYRQVVYKGPITLCCYCCWMNTSSGESLEGYQMASFLARDTSLRCARHGDGDDSWYVYGTFEPPDEGGGFFTVQTLVETLHKFGNATWTREEGCLCAITNNDKHLLIDALTGEEVVAYEVGHDT